MLLNIQRQPGANVIEVVDRIKALLPSITDNLPAGINVSVLTDRTQTIRASVTDVQHELLIAIALVVMVTFLFLRRASATIIPSVAVPLSLIGTFGVMYLAGFSVNNLTLMALTIATGSCWKTSRASSRKATTRCRPRSRGPSRSASPWCR